jgi:N-acyl-L-homoserine lactone synthetase
MSDNGLNAETGNSPFEAAGVTMDRLARRAVAWSAPVRFTLAQTPAERELAFRLRYEAVIARGWHVPKEFPDGLEHDSFDDDLTHAAHLLGWHGSVAVAAARLIFPSSERPLPTEEAFNLRIEPAGQVVDAGRFVVARSHSSSEHRVLVGLLAFGWLTVRARGFAHVCSAFASGASLNLYRRMGARMTVLAPPRLYWGEERYPILWDIVDTSFGLSERWRKLDGIGAPQTE